MRQRWNSAAKTREVEGNEEEGRRRGGGEGEGGGGHEVHACCLKMFLQNHVFHSTWNSLHGLGGDSNFSLKWGILSAAVFGSSMVMCCVAANSHGGTVPSQILLEVMEVMETRGDSVGRDPPPAHLNFAYRTLCCSARCRVLFHVSPPRDVWFRISHSRGRLKTKAAKYKTRNSN